MRILLILTVVFTGGCYPDYYYSGVKTNYIYIPEDQCEVVYYPQQNNSSTYWQEENARQEYYRSLEQDRRDLHNKLQESRHNTRLGY